MRQHNYIPSHAETLAQVPGTVTGLSRLRLLDELGGWLLVFEPSARGGVVDSGIDARRGCNGSEGAGHIRA